MRLTGQPETLTRALAGRVWQKAIARTELDAAKALFPVISTRLTGGRTLIHVLADAVPGPGFVPIEPTLEDVYFASIGGQLDPAHSAPALA